MRVVYIDSLFLLNFTVDYLLLLSAARMAGEVLHRVRFLLAAAAGGLYACGIFLPGLGFLQHPLCAVSAAVLMALIAYGGARRLMRLTLLFLALSCALGGAVLAVGYLGGRAVGLKNGILWPQMDMKTVLLAAAVCYLVFALVFRRLFGGKQGKGGIVPVTVELFGHKVSCRALIDTGNSLTDPLSGKPVLVAEGERMTPLFPREQMLRREELYAPAEAMERFAEGPMQGRLRLIPYRAIGVEQGMLLALRPDRVTINGESYGTMLVALSPGPVTESGTYCALVGVTERGGTAW